MLPRKFECVQNSRRLLASLRGMETLEMLTGPWLRLEFLCIVGFGWIGRHFLGNFAFMLTSARIGAMKCARIGFAM